ncbi:MAG: Tex family protein [Azospirillaceae bacterium]|nr:Tex family protein [Azospirillaceae bacterium]
MISITQRIADALSAREAQVEAAIKLLDEGSTVPFIARYRKEATGGLDDTQLRLLEERLGYLRELEDRRTVIIGSIREQGKLTDALLAQISEADTKTRLEDLYLPYRPKRRTKAQIAREAGLEPLALGLLNDPTVPPEAAALAFVDLERNVPDVKTALEGARHILAEVFAEDAALVGQLRTLLKEQGRAFATVVEEKRAEGAKFSDYFDFAEPLKDIPSHRALAMFRGRSAGVLDLRLDLNLTDPTAPHPAEAAIARHFNIIDLGRPGDAWLQETARWCWKTKLSLHLEVDLLGELRDRAEEDAIRVFARNLHDLLLAAPAGPRATIGLDPGIRTGVKVAVVDATGKVVETTTIYPHAPRNEWDPSIAVLAALAIRHKIDLISIGNGTASRETDKLVGDLMKQMPELKLTKLVVSEAGASIYSASEVAALEFPDLDVTLRGAVSIARRLQDPLAELVKIEPRSIGVGQYQHDVSSAKLAKALDAVVEDCVNAIGVDLNTASVPLLARVSGLNESVARNIVDYRDHNGAFRSRQQLMDIARLGPKTFEQAAGFLRIRDGDQPLDGSAVHPEAYPVVERIVGRTGRELGSLIGDARYLRSLNPEDFTDEQFGLPTIKDILAELEKPGRDPRPEFRAAAFKDGVVDLKHLEPGMVLEGAVTNVTAFGAFVDVGVHQDGLVHISQLANKFVKDPHAVVKAGDIVKVKVLEVDVARKRISLTMRLAEPEAPAAPAKAAEPRPPRTASNGNGAAAAPAGARNGANRGGERSGDRNAAPSRAAKPEGARPGRNEGPRHDGPRHDGPRPEGGRSGKPAETRRPPAGVISAPGNSNDGGGALAEAFARAQRDAEARRKR